ncbi:hypothetical protein CVT24_003672 [Panaeolus cyanescens]|uniref:Cytochrome b-c1 complex subunit 2, mitochondrial n=1 Tax=Panaeolus cyanescens TaxID=181874 RepID=A0A409VUP1_9AGAR|nr:hypothetical protein CVT24_003672 [Panaeolus cyanescens]
MLATRTSTARSVQRLARSFATATDSAGVKVAAVDNNQPTASVTVLVKAGTRFQPKVGVANALKNFAFKSTSKRTTIGTVRESELYGGVLSSSLGREHLALTAEFLPADAPFFVDLLTSYVTSAKFTRHEFEEYVTPLVHAETEAAIQDPATRAINAAHALAFRSGLGQPLFASEHSSVSVEDVKAFASQAFSKGNVAVVGTGIDQATLASLVEKGFASAAASSPLSSPATQYFGGETRIDAHGAQTVFIGFGSAGAPSSELSALAAHLSTNSSVKWSQGLSPLASIPGVQTVYLPYSDASLFGLLVQGPTAAAVKESAKAAVAALKSASQNIQADSLQAAIAKAKFSAASAVETREGLVAAIGPKANIFSTDLKHKLNVFYKKVDAAGLSKAASSLFAAKPTYVVVGDAAALPYADELGL